MALTLNHEVLDDTMELGSLIAKSFRARGQFGKVLSCLWNGLAEETDLNGANCLATNCHVKENLILIFNLDIKRL